VAWSLSTGPAQRTICHSSFISHSKSEDILPDGAAITGSYPHAHPLDAVANRSGNFHYDYDRSGWRRHLGVCHLIGDAAGSPIDRHQIADRLNHAVCGVLGGINASVVSSACVRSQFTSIKALSNNNRHRARSRHYRVAGRDPSAKRRRSRRGYRRHEAPLELIDRASDCSISFVPFREHRSDADSASCSACATFIPSRGVAKVGVSSD